MTETFLFAVEKPASLNDFLREELPNLLQDQNCAQNSLQAKDCGAAAKIAVSNSKIRRLIFSQNVFVCPNGSQAQDARRAPNHKASQAKDGDGFFVCKNPAFSLKKNARVKVLFDKEKFFYEKQNGDIEFELDDSRVLYEDDAIIVVNKPPHFPTEATFAQDRDNLRSAVVRYLHKKIGLDKNPPYCGIVHRLDRDTSGVILFSKKRTCNAALFAAFDSSEAAGSSGLASSSGQGRAAKKIYVAVCEAAGSYGLAKSSCITSNFGKDQKAAGSLSLANISCNGQEFSVQNYLGRVSLKSQAAKWGSVAKEKGGKFARTDFKILKEKGGRFFVQAELWTGRTHQIRVHLSQKGLPILGDELYGGRADQRIYLHALTLELPHPESGQLMRFEAPLSPEFAALF
ncbi:MAG: RluA family pseudouridine synthase [Treponema sp.]|nr:RluA family pseudouridine synthase [Treponema sp.]